MWNQQITFETLKQWQNKKISKIRDQIEQPYKINNINNINLYPLVLCSKNTRTLHLTRLQSRLGISLAPLAPGAVLPGGPGTRDLQSGPPAHRPVLQGGAGGWVVLGLCSRCQHDTAF